jgi:hypothetical protein
MGLIKFGVRRADSWCETDQRPDPSALARAMLMELFKMDVVNVLPGPRPPIGDTGRSGIFFRRVCRFQACPIVNAMGPLEWND